MRRAGSAVLPAPGQKVVGKRLTNAKKCWGRMMRANKGDRDAGRQLQVPAPLDRRVLPDASCGAGGLDRMDSAFEATEPVPHGVPAEHERMASALRTGGGGPPKGRSS